MLKVNQISVKTTEFEMPINNIQTNVLEEFMCEIFLDEPDSCKIYVSEDIRWKNSSMYVNIEQTSVTDTEGNTTTKPTLTLSPKCTYLISVSNGLGIITSFNNKSLEVTTITTVTYGKQYSWTPVENAERYDVYVDNVLITSTTETGITSEDYFNSEVGAHTIKIVAVSSKFTDSVATVTYSVNGGTLSTPTNFVVNDAGVVSWDPVPNATRYNIEYRDTTTNTAYYYDTYTTNNYIDLNTLASVKIENVITILVTATASYYTSSNRASFTYNPNEV